MTDTFNVYEFDREQFVEVVGTDAPKEDIKLKIDILEEKKEVRKPSNPNEAAPQGGFKTNTYKCRAVEVLK